VNFLEFHYRGYFLGKPRMTRADTWKKRPCVTKYWAYKDRLVEAASKVGYKVGDDLDIMFSIAMPPSWSNKKREEFLNKPHQQKPDIDNLCKGFLDCLMKDDSRVWHLNATKYWGLENEIYVFKK